MLFFKYILFVVFVLLLFARKSKEKRKAIRHHCRLCVCVVAGPIVIVAIITTFISCLKLVFIY